MCSGIINNQPCNITAILPTRVVVYGVEERGVGDDIVKVKRSTTVAAAARPPPVTTARNWLRTTRTWTPGWRLQCDGVTVWCCYLFSCVSPVCPVSAGGRESPLTLRFCNVYTVEREDIEHRPSRRLERDWDSLPVSDSLWSHRYHCSPCLDMAQDQHNICFL